MQVDFSEESGSGITLKLKKKVIPEKYVADGKDATRMGMCKGLQDVSCLKSNLSRTTLYFTEGLYVCEACNANWEAKNGADSRKADIVKEETPFKEMEVTFTIERSG